MALKIGVLQIESIIGDLCGNAEKIKRSALNLSRFQPDLLVTPELCLWGYPAKDFLFIENWLRLSEEYLEKIAMELAGCPPLVVGSVERSAKSKGKRIHNSAMMLYKGKVSSVARKINLPNYGIFNESRYFEPDIHTIPVRVSDQTVVFSICEDIWNSPGFSCENSYENDYHRHLEKLDFDLMVNLSASPFEKNKLDQRLELAEAFSARYSADLLYCNSVGAHDGVVFDGCSFLYGKNRTAYFCKSFEEDCRLIPADSPAPAENSAQNVCWEENATKAIRLAIASYLRKNGFRKVVLGLSGGVDSALVCTLACSVVGPENLIPVLMPSKYSSRGSIEDSIELCKNLGVQPLTIPIQDLADTYSKALDKIFADDEADLTEENLQSRIRGNLLMALSNKWKALLLNTGNKSELAVGYCTIYGDMCGALAIIADLWKTEVYQICAWLNSEKETIPANILIKAPSAELRFDQKDSDSLPEYEVLDSILKAFVEKGQSSAQIIQAGLPPETVKNTLHLLQISEFKRRQSPPIVKVSARCLGEDWNMPISSRYPE